MARRKGNSRLKRNVHGTVGRMGVPGTRHTPREEQMKTSGDEEKQRLLKASMESREIHGNK
jgi:hypothetical protein